MSNVYSMAVQGAHIWRRGTHIFRFLKDERCAVRVVEVRLFKTSRLSERAPMETRRWETGSDLAKTAKEISKYIADSGSGDGSQIARKRADFDLLSERSEN
jgi:hypothetical protein